MQVTTELQEMFSYSLLPIFFIIILIAIFTFLIFRKKKLIVNNIDLKIPKAKDINIIKNNYLLKIDNLTINFNNNKISSRKAYQNLSSLIRNFIYETTNIKVQNYTLKDIKKINMPMLYELISEYYDPEFSKISKGNILLSLEKARKVIEKWN